MSLKYNGVTPASISYNGTNLTVVKYNGSAIWGKKYSLSLNCDSNTTLTVKRTSSPNQHATTGTLSNGSPIYYGDILYVTAVANSGGSLSTLTSNGSSINSGNYITVTSNISIQAASVSAPSWKTVFSGSLIASYDGDRQPTIPNILMTNTPTKVSYNVCIVTPINTYYNEFFDVDMPVYSSFYAEDGFGNFDYFIDGGTGSSSTLGVIMDPWFSGTVYEAYVEVTQVKQYY